ncbi:MAG TPA: hypothetical protein VNO30_25165 [Kofleriaceae bacterium]|nr:hypothetical protein [Kofleriaceae bacterium]
MLPEAWLRPRGAREHLARAFAALADGARRAVRFFTDVVGAVFGV